MENNRRGSEIFLGVIGVATLVVAIIGATFAFFSASTNSESNAVSVQSTALGLDFVDSINKNLKTHLIPAAENIATYAALMQSITPNQGDNAQCVDDNGNDVCGVYQFTVCNGTLEVVNEAKTNNCQATSNSTQDVYFTLNVATNEFTNLKYKIYTGAVTNLTSSSTAKTSGTTFPSSGSSTQLKLGNLSAAEDEDLDNDGQADGMKYHLGTAAGSNSVTYTMVIWLDETGSNQSVADSATLQNNESRESGKAFAAGITVSTGSGSGVTGVIAAAGNNG